MSLLHPRHRWHYISDPPRAEDLGRGQVLVLDSSGWVSAIRIEPYFGYGLPEPEVIFMAGSLGEQRGSLVMWRPMPDPPRTIASRWEQIRHWFRSWPR